MGLAELTRNAVDVLPEGGLERKLALGRPLRVKLGIDVTSPDIHVGRAIGAARARGVVRPLRTSRVRARAAATPRRGARRGRRPGGVPRNLADSPSVRARAREGEYLVGSWPEEIDLYRERSPVTHADRISKPLLLLQGLDDKVVPPSQAEAIIAALERNSVPYAYVAFAGEGHGFRGADAVRRSNEAFLSFTGQVFGFEPADALEPVEIRNLERAAH